MKWYKKIFKKHVAWLLLLPFLLAIIGIDYGLPMHLVGDEESLIGGSMKMLELRNFVPATEEETFAFFYYPPVLGYLVVLISTPVILFKFLGLGFSAAAVQDFFALNQNNLWYAARLLTALTSVGVLATVYAIAKSLFSKRVAFISALVLATSFFHVVLSHWMRHWMYTTFFAYLTILLGVWFVKKGQKKHAYLAAIVGGIGFGASYVSILGFGVVLAYWWYNRDHIKDFWNTVLKTSAVAALVGGVLAALNFPELVRILSPVDGTLSHPKSLVDLLVFGRDFLSIIGRQEIIISLLSIMGVFVLWRSHKQFVSALLFAIAAYIVLFYFFFHLELRYVYPLIPALSMLSALVIEKLIVGIKQQKAAALVVGLILLWPMMSALQYTYLLTQSDTREIAERWIQAEVAPEETLIISSESIRLPRSVVALEREQKYGTIRAPERYFLAHANLQEEQSERYNITNIHFWDSDRSLADFESFVETYQPRYAVIDYRPNIVSSKQVQWIEQNGTLIQRITQSELLDVHDINGNFFAFNSVLFKLKRLGTTVDVYELPRTATN